METILTDDAIKVRLASGAAFLSLRRVIFQIVLTASNIILARILAPEVFGSYAIISFLVSFVAIFTTIGLSPAIVQSKKIPSKEQLRVLFTVLLVTSSLLVVLVYFLTPLSNIIYNNQLDSNTLFWLRLLSLKVLLTSLSVIPAALLEKKLDYKKLTIAELLVLFCVKLITINLAMRGLGIGSFVIGELVGAAVGVAIYYYFSSCPIGLNFNIAKIKDNLLFGLNIQLSSIIGFFNAAIIPGFVGRVSGPSAVGLINWAGGVRQIGMAPNDIIGRLVFPASAQAQDRPVFLKKLIEKIINISSLLSLPLLALVFALAKPITYIVYTSVWLSGLTALYLGVIQAIFMLLGGILMDVLIALGEAKTYRNIVLFWAIAQWGLAIPLVLLWNFNGVMLAGILVSSTFFVPLHFVKKRIDINIWPHFLPYLAFSVIIAGILILISQVYLVENFIDLVLLSLLGLSLYSIMILAFKKEEIKNDFVALKRILVK